MYLRIAYVISFSYSWLLKGEKYAYNLIWLTFRLSDVLFDHKFYMKIAPDNLFCIKFRILFVYAF